MPTPTQHQLRLISWLLRLTTAAGLAIDAYVHADLAGLYNLNQGSAAISQGDLFRAEAGLSAFAALAVIATAWRATWALAFLVAGSALGGLLLYRYYDPGSLGPLPDMYEPSWYPEKTLAAAAEAVVVITAALGLVLHGWWLRRTPRQRPTQSEKPAPPTGATTVDPVKRDSGDTRASLGTVHRMEYRRQVPHHKPRR